MKFVKRMVLDLDEEKRLKDLGFILSFRYSIDYNSNLFDVFVTEISH